MKYNSRKYVDLMSLLKIETLRTINIYIEKKLIPPPVKFVKGIPLWYEKDIKKILGVEGELGEMITTEQAEKILVKMKSVHSLDYFVRHGFINRYRIDRVKGSKEYYMKTQIEELKYFCDVVIHKNTKSIISKSKITIDMFNSILNLNCNIFSLNERDLSIMKMYFCYETDLQTIGDAHAYHPEQIRNIISDILLRIPRQLKVMFESASSYKKKCDELSTIIKIQKRERKNLVECAISDQVHSQGVVIDDSPSDLLTLLSTPIASADVSVRVKSVLLACQINTIGDLVVMNRNDLLQFKNFGHKSLNELDNFMLNNGLYFGMNLSLS